MDYRLRRTDLGSSALYLCLYLLNVLYPSKKLQIINVYNQEYESAAAFWPDVHGRIIYALIFSQVVLMGLLSTKKAAQSTPFLIALPVITISFHLYCKGRYEPAFIRYPIEVCQTLFSSLAITIYVHPNSPILSIELVFPFFHLMFVSYQF